MLLKRKRPLPQSSCHKEVASVRTTSRLFRKGPILVQRAPVMSGLSVHKKFQRPMLKRRAYSTQAEQALRQSSLGPKRRMNGMAKLMARAGRGLSFKVSAPKTNSSDTENSDDDSEEEEEEDRPFEPLCVWQSPHPQQESSDADASTTLNRDHVEARGLPPRTVSEVRPDEYGVEHTVQVLRPAPLAEYSRQDVFVPPVLAKWLRPHQREGVQFMYECVMALKDFQGQGCILADDMGLGKTLQSVTLIYTLLKTGITADKAPTAKRVIVVCPCSLVKNWDNEFVKWLGPGTVKALALAEADRKTVEKNIDIFVRTKMFNILICSYECIRAHIKRFTKYSDCCDLLVCDEAHRLKNSDNQTSKALNSLPVKRRVLLTGTPMQNDLQEFYAMVDFTNPGILGSPEEFRRKMLFPILRGREPDATEAQKRKMMQIQNDMSTIVNDFILRRVNTLNAQHLPPKLVQVVCCNLTEIQQNMYQHLVNSKDMQHIVDGKQVNCLGSIQMLMKLCNHPSLVAEDDSDAKPTGNRRGVAIAKYNEDEKETAAAPGADGIAKFLPYVAGEKGRKNDFTPVHPEWSGKMFVLYRLMKEMRKPGNGNDKIVIVSNYTQTLDLIGRMCRQNSWGFCRLDGSINMKKRQKMVDEFNDPNSNLVAFLLSSKAGGCGLNLIGGNRLVLFDPDWNPAVDKQAAARCWRDGQKKRCFTYRFLATGTVEEKIFQRQLSKEGLQSVVDDKEQVNALSTKDLRNLFKLRVGTPSDTHDKLKCERCEIIHDTAELEAQQVLPKKLAACRELLREMMGQDDAKPFLEPLDPTVHGTSKEEYERLVKQPMDLSSISKKLDADPGSAASYSSVSGFSKDVNRIFSNVMKVWSPGDEIADISRRLQSWWVEQWTELVPRLMTIKADEAGPGEENAECVDESTERLLGSASLNNERGENYQEQIGMPDEENMRHWSHHHSTDTCDDPVFRAAMRGCDSVSFVFGLEVTWSLIQQRQQEEEERVALAALEEEKDGAEAENSGDESEEEPDSKIRAVDPIGGDGHDEEDSVPDVNIFGCESDADIPFSTSGNGKESSETEDPDPNEDLRDSDSEDNLSLEEEKKGTCCVDSDDGESVYSVKHAASETKTPEAVPVESSTKSTPCAVAEVYTSSQESEKENLSCDVANSQPSPKEWACPTCTLHNKKAKRKCIACGTRKPMMGRKRTVGELYEVADLQ